MNDSEIPETHEGVMRLLERDVYKFNSIREANPHWKVDLSGANLRGIDSSKWNVKVNLLELNLTQANLFEAKLSRSDLTKAILIKVNGVRVNLSNSKLAEACLREARLAEAKLSGADLTEADLREADLTEANLIETNLTKADLTEANLVSAKLVRAELLEAKLVRANLSGSDLRNANLSWADLRHASFDYKTNMSGAIVKGAKIYKFGLEQLKDYGGLTYKQLREMEITYDLGKLRQEFSGWKGFIHVLFLILFLTPYVFYIVKQITISNLVYNSVEQSKKVKNDIESRLHVTGNIINSGLKEEIKKLPLSSEAAKNILERIEQKINEQNKSILEKVFVEKPKETSIAKSLWDYIITSNVYIFCFLLIYNLLRGLLLWKTKSLENLEAIQGLSSDFTFESNKHWYVFYRWMNWLTYVNVGLVLYRICLFGNEIIYFY
ncbi:MAG: pentapeptide repeat-containing protein [Blastocatellia bacterium]